MKIDARIETIFAHAAALDQSGRLRSTIQVNKRYIYILNTDKTVLMRFALPASAPYFASKVTFNANDYDSVEFDQEGDQVNFTQRGSEYIRTKSCGIPDQPDMEEIFACFDLPEDNKLVLTKELTTFLNPSLSHTEFRIENREPIIIQRNIYDGTMIKIIRRECGGFNVGPVDEIGDSEFGPIGVRTNDFLALFTFNDLIEMHFGSGLSYCRVRGRNFRMDCVIAFCLYDEMGTTTLSKGDEDNGRKEPQDGPGEPGPHREIEKGQHRRTEEGPQTKAGMLRQKAVRRA